MADEPLLFHCGHKFMFDSVRGAVEKLIPVERLRWISFSHFEADESGTMNLWQERAPRALQDGETLDLGGKRVRYLATPHVPHGWDAGLMFEEQGGRLLCSDLLGQVGDGPALAAGDVVAPALQSEAMWRSISVTAETAPTLERLAALDPKTLAIMHGSSINRGCAIALREFSAGLVRQRLAVAA